MKKIIDLIKSLLGGGSAAQKAVELQQLETAVKEEVKVVEEKIYNKTFFCEKCNFGELNFKYKVISIEVPNSVDYTGQVDIAVSVGEDGWGTLYDNQGNEKKFSTFSRVVDNSDSRFHNYLHDSVRENIEEQINEVFLVGTGFSVRVDYLDFIPSRFF